ncbi:hypothetical protein ACFFNY_28540 [Paenibacillus hodogayensis]|uniref:Uncharacterized protein n=1 Tax=Paenibacillus hodogayensis TaxID=279208 RepID=A0ABV5W4R9_9BACL
MKSTVRIMAAVLISIGFAAVLSIVPELDGSVQSNGAETPVFRSDYAVTLSERNLVDLLVRAKLRLNVAHVEFSDSILSVDLKTKSGGMSAEAIYEDLYELSSLGFSGTKNVKQLLVRVMEQPAGKDQTPQLLLAMDAKRTDLGGGATEAGLRGRGTKEQYLSSHFSLTYTRKWLDQYR